MPEVMVVDTVVLVLIPVLTFFATALLLGFFYHPTPPKWRRKKKPPLALVYWRYLCRVIPEGLKELSDEIGYW